MHDTQSVVLDRPSGATRSAVSGSRFTMLGKLGQAIPPVLVFSILGGLLVWGHRSNWTMPKFSVLLGGGGGKDDWCSEHSVPESECVECNKELMPRSKGHRWCGRHGVHECPLCDPGVAQLPSRPSPVAADLQRAKRALDFAERPENNRKCKLYERRIQFASAESVDKAGVQVEAVWQAPMIETVRSHGEVDYDPTHLARLSTRVPGTVWRVEKQVGAAVRRGDVLALVDAADVGKAKTEFLQAAAQVVVRAKSTEPLEALRTSGVVSEVRYREAHAALEEASIRLHAAEQVLLNLGLPIRAGDVQGLSSEEIGRRIQFLGLPEAIATQLDPRTTTASLIPLRAALDGVVVARDAVAGEVVDSARVLFVVADVQCLLLTLDLRLEDVATVVLGQTVHFHPDGSKNASEGTIDWISTGVDHRTRTVKVRAHLDNPAGRLRANTFGSGRIVLREEKQAIVVPNEAVHWEGDCHVVFVRDKDFLKEGHPKIFHTRTVRLGTRDDRHTEIIAGVLPGELVATAGSAVLRAELLKGKLGEG